MSAMGLKTFWWKDSSWLWPSKYQSKNIYDVEIWAILNCSSRRTKGMWQMIKCLTTMASSILFLAWVQCTSLCFLLGGICIKLCTGGSALRISISCEKMLWCVVSIMGTLKNRFIASSYFVVTYVGMRPKFFLKASCFTCFLKLLCTKAFEVPTMLYQDHRIWQKLLELHLQYDTTKIQN